VSAHEAQSNGNDLRSHLKKKEKTIYICVA
jgi:hypothetical protein